MTIVADVLRAPFMQQYRAASGASFDAERVLELAFLAASSDGNVGDEELTSLREVASDLGLGGLESRLDAFNERLAASSYGDRVLEVARALEGDATRRFTFCLVCALNVSDMNAAPDEADLEEWLAEAWGLADDVLDLKGQVMRMFLLTDE